MPLTREIQSFAVKSAGESCPTNIKKKGNVLNEKKNLMLTAPWNEEAEAVVLCSVLLEPNLIHKVRATLDTSDFFSHRHKRIFASMIKLSSDKEPIDILTVCNVLDDNEDKMYVTSVIEEATCTTQALTHYMGKIKETSVLRMLMQMGQKVLSTASSDSSNPQEILSETQRTLNDVVSSLDGVRGKNEIIGPDECGDLVMDNLNNRISNPGVQGILTGFPVLARTIRGLRRIVVLSATTGRGKTTMGIALACNIGIRQKIPMLYLNYEMGKNELLARIQANLSSVPVDEIETGEFTNGNQMKVVDTVDKITKGNLYISGNEPKTIDHTINLIYRYKMEAGIRVVVIDYLGEISPDKYKVDNRESDYHTFSRAVQSIKDICSSLDIDAIILSQLNREGHGGVPSLDKVAGSIDIARKANVFLILGYDSNLASERGLRSPPNYLKVEKNRAGRHPVTIPIDFNGDCQQIKEAL